jgi:hypothetical protein
MFVSASNEGRVFSPNESVRAYTKLKFVQLLKLNAQQKREELDGTCGHDGWLAA